MASSVSMRIAEQVGFFTGLGVVIVFIAAFAVGRIFSLPADALVEETIPVETRPQEPVA